MSQFVITFDEDQMKTLEFALQIASGVLFDEVNNVQTYSVQEILIERESAVDELLEFIQGNQVTETPVSSIGESETIFLDTMDRAVGAWFSGFSSGVDTDAVAGWDRSDWVTVVGAHLRQPCLWMTAELIQKYRLHYLGIE